MARVLKRKRDEVIRLSSDMPKDERRNSELVLVPGGKRRAYLWTMNSTYSGEKALRALARAILKELR